MKKNKVLLMMICFILLVVASVMGTFAYLTSEDAIINTFTIGQVHIVLDETKVTPDGKAVIGAARVKENNYHLVPGRTYTKDPTVTVVKGSEESYIRVLVTVNCLKELDAAFAPDGADLNTVFNGYDASNWLYEDAVRDAANNTVTYEFRYKEAVKPEKNTDLVLDALFDSISVPGTMTGDQLKTIADLKINVEAHAIQKSGFETEDAAWTAFNEQING